MHRNRFLTAGPLCAGLLLLLVGPILLPVAMSKSCYFGIVNILIPAMSALGSFLAVSTGFSLYVLVKIALGVYPITSGLPTLASIASLRGNADKKGILHWLVNIALPLLCIALFALHPVGWEAIAYSGYWLIPLAIGLWSLRRRPIPFFMHALGATFIAHAVGSVIWIYLRTTTPIHWIALIPRVALERFTLAAGITAVYSLLPMLKPQALRTLFLQRRKVSKK